MRHSTTTHIGSAAAALLSAALATASGLPAWAYRQFTRRQTIHVLQGLDDRTLKDIGLDRSEIESAVDPRHGERKTRIDMGGFMSRG